MLHAVSRALLRVDGSNDGLLERSLTIAVALTKSSMAALAAAPPVASDRGELGLQAAATGEATAREWTELRVSMQAASLMWLQHTSPAIVRLAADMLATFDRSAPAAANVAGAVLIHALSATWGMKSTLGLKVCPL